MHLVGTSAGVVPVHTIKLLPERPARRALFDGEVSVGRGAGAAAGSRREV